jgi:alpha-galactosidase
MKIRLLYFLLLFLCIACSQRNVPKPESTTDDSASNATVDYQLTTDKFSVIGDVQPFKTEIKIDTVEENLYVVNLSLYTDFPSSLPPFQLNIKYPKKFINVLWSSRTWSTNSYIVIPNYAKLQSDYNIVSASTKSSKNRMTLASYDMFGSRYTGIDIGLDRDSVKFIFNFFKDAVPSAEVLEFKTQILVDLRDMQFSKSIRGTAQWRLDKEGPKTISKVNVDLLPVYSLWFPLHKNIPVENVTHYFDSIASMGFRSVLFDDGWQNVVKFNIDKDGYWDPSEATVIKDFIAKAKEKNMKVALWYSQPFLGAHKYVFEKFEGRYLQYVTSSQPIMDIRYPEVRQYLTDIYKRVISEWEVDGIWFNFLDGYYPDEQIIVLEDHGRDFVSVRKALDSLRTKMTAELLEVNPNLSINQSYHAVGPMHTSNTQTINGFMGTTVIDQVREKLVNNRLMYGDYSPFMEVMGIHPKDPPLDVALKFQTILFGTPYVSYFSYTLPEDVQQTLSFWIKYWKANSQYLLTEEFEAYEPLSHYSVLKSGNETKQIVGIYERTGPFDMGSFSFETADVINSSDSPYITLAGMPAGKVDYITYDYNGKFLNKGTLKFKNNIVTLEIPIGGFARLIMR